jgi:sulfofructose kinase
MRVPVVVPAGRGIDVVGVGQNTVDHLCVVDAFPSVGAKGRLHVYEVQPGGQVATALVALSRWGARAAYVGVFGGDDAGRRARAALVADGVDVSAAPVREHEANQVSVILVDAPSGERTVLWHRSAGLALDPAEVPVARIAGARVLHLDGLDGAAALAAAAAARRAGVPVVADIDTAVPETSRLLELVDVVLVSWEFARVFSGAEDPEAALDALACGGAAVVGVTLGRDGVMARAGGRLVRVPGHRVMAVDTTGAGDVLHAGFIWGMLAGLDLQASLTLANAAAALQCTAVGGRRGIPSLAAARALAGV